MNYFNISLLIGGIVGLSSAFLVFVRNRHIGYNRAWFWLNVFTAIWSFGYFIMITSTNYNVSLFSNWILHFAASLIPSYFLYFVIAFVGEIKKFKRLLYFSFFISIVFVILTPTRWFIKDVIPKYIFNYVCDAGPLYIPFTIFFFAIVLLSLGILLLSLKKYSSIFAYQIKYIFLTSIFGFAGGSSVFFLTFNVNFPPYPLILFSLYPIVVTYAITRYRLFDIKYFLTRSILYGILVASVAAFFALSVLVAGEIIKGNTQTSKIITYIITSFIIVVFLDPVKRIWARITDNIFYKDKIDYQLLLQETGRVVSREIDLHKLLSSVCLLLAKSLKIKQVAVFVPMNGKYDLLASSDEKQKNFSLGRLFVEYIKNDKEILIVEELLRNQSDNESNSDSYKQVDGFIKDAEIIGAEMIMPIVESGELTAIFVFKAKYSGDLYDQNDINFLKILSPQIATAIEKSKLYEEVEKFNRELQQKVDERTKSLKEVNLTLEERNRFLTTVQVVTTMVSRTLDLKKINQMIADAIESELGYVGGILSFIDEDRKAMKVGAITATKNTIEAMSLLPQEPREYESKLEEDFNLGVQSALTGKIIFSDKMSDFFSPPVDKAVIDTIQKKLGIKTAVAVPIFSEEKIIGVINFLLSVEKSKVSSMDIEIMHAITNQVGIVFRNLRLYNFLQKANRDLQDANMRLRELDKAKSEFLSIASHQLRTPISALKGYLSMMLDGDYGKLPENIQQVIANLFESASRLARLINIFLNVSRIESGRLKLEKRPLQINELIDSVIIELANQAKQKGLKLEYKKDKKVPPLILADSDKLREVILNLVDNSIKYTPTGKVEVLLEYDQKQLTFKVKDTGIGIDPEEAKTLFRKFVRGSGVAQIHTGGSGLGLFIAQKIIKEHDGNIWVESEGKGKGSTFQFVVPVYDEHKGPEYKSLEAK